MMRALRKVEFDIFMAQNTNFYFLNDNLTVVVHFNVNLVVSTLAEKNKTITH